MNRISDFLVGRHAFYLVITLFIAFSFLTESCRTRENRYENDSVWSLPPFKKQGAMGLSLRDTVQFLCPVLQHKVSWLKKNVYLSSVNVKGNIMYLFFSGQDDQNVSRIGVAVSGDGINFSKIKQPILFPEEDFMKPYEQLGGIGNPRIVENENGTYILNYTAYDRGISRLCIASSVDLLNWTKHGPAFSESYFNISTSSGSMIARREENRIVAQKINGKYWMYFANDSLFAAISDDLIHWEPAKDAEGEAIKSQGENYGGSGPFALSTSAGIVLPNNQKDMTTQLLFDPEDPTKIIDRLALPFMINGEPEPKKLAGLVAFKNTWFAYYPLADSIFGVATSQP